ncbi:MAG: aliphatic sulfonate ABC transporter substrate-binding protein [Blautia sp.]|nr:aliphatic sulfonate ABC transporter substrate-binding protein [Blautia sp.]
MKKRALSLLFAAALTISTLGGSTLVRAAEDDPYTDLGIELTSTDVTIVVAEQTYYIAPIIAHFGWYDKFFSENNIKVDSVNFDNGPEIIEAMTADAVDWGPMGTQPAVSGAANGANISAVASFVDQSKSAVLATLSDDINTVEDLKGKKIGAKVGSSEYAFLLWALQGVGLSVDDVEVINLDIATVATALENGEVDAAVANINRFIRVEVDDGVEFKYVTNAVGSGTALQIIAVRNEFAEAHPDIISALLQFYVWAEDFIANNHDEAIEIISDYFGLEPDIPETTLTYQTYAFTPLQEFYDTTDSYLDFMYDNEYITDRIPTEDFVQLQYAEAIGLP